MNNAIIAAASVVSSLATIVLVLVTRRYVQLMAESVKDIKAQHLLSVSPLLLVFKFEMFVGSRRLRLGVRNAGTGMAVSSIAEIFRVNQSGALETIGRNNFGDLLPSRSSETDVQLSQLRGESDSSWVVEWAVTNILGDTFRLTQRIDLSNNDAQFGPPVRHSAAAGRGVPGAGV